MHNKEELQDSINEHIDLLGVNNRDLKTFETSVAISKELANEIPSDFVKVSESGISNPQTISDLKTYGYEGFLIGENFMKSASPGKSAAKFINELKMISDQ